MSQDDSNCNYGKKNFSSYFRDDSKCNAINYAENESIDSLILSELRSSFFDTSTTFTQESTKIYSCPIIRKSKLEFSREKVDAKFSHIPSLPFAVEGGEFLHSNTSGSLGITAASCSTAHISNFGARSMSNTENKRNYKNWTFASMPTSDLFGHSPSPPTHANDNCRLDRSDSTIIESNNASSTVYTNAHSSLEFLSCTKSRAAPYHRGVSPSIVDRIETFPPVEGNIEKRSLAQELSYIRDEKSGTHINHIIDGVEPSFDSPIPPNRVVLDNNVLMNRTSQNHSESFVGDSEILAPDTQYELNFNERAHDSILLSEHLSPEFSMTEKVLNQEFNFPLTLSFPIVEKNLHEETPSRPFQKDDPGSAQFSPNIVCASFDSTINDRIFFASQTVNPNLGLFSSDPQRSILPTVVPTVVDNFSPTNLSDSFSSSLINQIISDFDKKDFECRQLSQSLDEIQLGYQIPENNLISIKSADSVSLKNNSSEDIQELSANSKALVSDKSELNKSHDILALSINENSSNVKNQSIFISKKRNLFDERESQTKIIQNYTSSSTPSIKIRLALTEHTLVWARWKSLYWAPAILKRRVSSTRDLWLLRFIHWRENRSTTLTGTEMMPCVCESLCPGDHLIIVKSRKRMDMRRAVFCIWEPDFKLRVSYNDTEKSGSDVIDLSRVMIDSVLFRRRKFELMSVSEQTQLSSLYSFSGLGQDLLHSNCKKQSLSHPSAKRKKDSKPLAGLHFLISLGQGECFKNSRSQIKDVLVNQESSNLHKELRSEPKELLITKSSRAKVRIQRARLATRIVALGGVLASPDQGLKEIFDKHGRNLLVLTDVFRRTEKILNALILGVPVIKIEWLNECERSCRNISWKPFLVFISLNLGKDLDYSGRQFLYASVPSTPSCRDKFSTNNVLSPFNISTRSIENLQFNFVTNDFSRITDDNQPFAFSPKASICPVDAIPNSITKSKSMSFTKPVMGIQEFFKSKKIILHGQSASFTRTWSNIAKTCGAFDVQRLQTTARVTFNPETDRIITEQDHGELFVKRRRPSIGTRLVNGAAGMGIVVMSAEQVITAILVAHRVGDLPIV